MSDLHGGTVTFVFTDIEGSTRLLERLGDRYAEALAEHRRIVRDAFGARGGRELDTQGDAFFYAFERARDAVAGTVAAQRALASHGWPDGRAARPDGRPHRRARRRGGGLRRDRRPPGGADLRGRARRPGAALGDDRGTRSGAMPDGVSQVPLGDVRLKDLGEPERVVQLEIDGLLGSFPPLRVEAEEPLDFGERLAQKIQADVERQLEGSLMGSGNAGARDSTTKLAKLAGIGLLLLVLVVAAAVGLVLLVVLLLF